MRWKQACQLDNFLSSLESPKQRGPFITSFRQTNNRLAGRPARSTPSDTLRISWQRRVKVGRSLCFCVSLLFREGVAGYTGTCGGCRERKQKMRQGALRCAAAPPRCAAWQRKKRGDALEEKPQPLDKIIPLTQREKQRGASRAGDCSARPNLTLRDGSPAPRAPCGPAMAHFAWRAVTEHCCSTAGEMGDRKMCPGWNIESGTGVAAAAPPGSGPGGGLRGCVPVVSPPECPSLLEG